MELILLSTLLLSTVSIQPTPKKGLNQEIHWVQTTKTGFNPAEAEEGFK
jgi:hypothetical protein